MADVALNPAETGASARGLERDSGLMTVNARGLCRSKVETEAEAETKIGTENVYGYYVEMFQV